MRRVLRGLLGAATILLCLATSVSADIKIKSKSTAGGSSFESTTYIKGARQRTEQNFGPGVSMASVYQCDLKRQIQLNDAAKTYMVQPLQTGDEAAPGATTAPAPEQGPARTRRGGVVTYTSNITDTGERKQMFGFTARRIVTSMVKEATPDACDPEKMRIESDGWYIDLEYGLYCSTDKPTAPPQMRPARPDCLDEVRFKQTGRGKLGYPLQLTTRMYDASGRESSSFSQEIIDLSTATLDAALFDVPPGYREVKNFQELAGVPSTGTVLGRTPAGEEPAATRPTGAKAAGMVRVGVVTISNKTNRPVSTDALREGLVAQISDANVDAVPLNAGTPAEIEAEAKAKECDYILYTDIAQLKQSGKVGGFLGRATGVGVVKEKSETRVDFRLFPVGSTSPKLTSSAAAKEEAGEQETVARALEKEASAVVAAVRK